MQNVTLVLSAHGLIDYNSCPISSAKFGNMLGPLHRISVGGAKKSVKKRSKKETKSNVKEYTKKKDSKIKKIQK